MSYDIRGNTGLGYEPMKRKEIGVFRLPEQSIEHGIDSKNGGSTIGVNGVTSVESCFF